jgi:hypothetical protein
MPVEKHTAFDSTNKIMSREIGDIRWCSLEVGSKLIRSDNVEKREMLLRVARLLRNYCPFQNGAISNIQLYGKQRGNFL